LRDFHPGDVSRVVAQPLEPTGELFSQLATSCLALLQSSSLIWAKWASADKVIGTRQLMFYGVSKRSKAVNRVRNKVGKWTDRKIKLSVFAKRQIHTMAVFDYVSSSL
jgi:hypothetical protein